MKKITELYAVYKTGLLGENILDTYFSFIAKIVLDGSNKTINEDSIREDFKNKYNIVLPTAFIRQLLGIGVQNGTIVSDHGVYSADLEKIKKYQFDPRDFEQSWNSLITEFSSFLKQNYSLLQDNNVESIILSLLDNEIFLDDDLPDEDITEQPLKYLWYRFIKQCAKNKSNLYNFITAITMSDSFREALFFEGRTSYNLNGLAVYLDTPIILALLGMDTEERQDSYKELIDGIRKAGGELFVFDHDWGEIQGIISRAAGWARSPEYNISKANNATRFFHDSGMSSEEIDEFIVNLESKINGFYISEKETSYDMQENKFQEDENKLFDLVKAKYTERSSIITPEKEKSIRIDTRSIIMVYRERKGVLSTKIDQSRHIFISSNNAIANASKQYESNKSINSGHIPACISADLFGAILWLNNPVSLMGYQKKKLLADCYCMLRPSRKLIGNFVKSLEEARENDEIDERKFLLLRSHPVVMNSLMNITYGDYARFSSKTYIEVYDDIVAVAREDFSEEVKKHSITKKSLEDAISQNTILKQNNEEFGHKIDQLSNSLNEQKLKHYNLKVSIAYRILEVLILVIPGGVVSYVIELLKCRFVSPLKGNFWIYFCITSGFSFALLFIPFIKRVIRKVAKWVIDKFYSADI